MGPDSEELLFCLSYQKALKTLPEKQLKTRPESSEDFLIRACEQGARAVLLNNSVLGKLWFSTREREDLKGFKHLCLKNSSSQGQNLASTVIFVPTSLDSGTTGVPRT